MDKFYYLIERESKYLRMIVAQHNNIDIKEFNKFLRQEDKEQKYIIQSIKPINQDTIKLYFYLTKRLDVKQYIDLLVNQVSAKDAIVYRQERKIKIINSDIIDRFIENYKINPDEI